MDRNSVEVSIGTTEDRVCGCIAYIFVILFNVGVRWEGVLQLLYWKLIDWQFFKQSLQLALCALDGAIEIGTPHIYLRRVIFLEIWCAIEELCPVLVIHGTTE